MRATPGKRLMSSQASAKDPAKPPPAAMSAVTSASTGSGRTGTASPTRARLYKRYRDQAQEHTARAQRTDLWPEDWGLQALSPLRAGRTLEVRKEMGHESNREPN